MGSLNVEFSLAELYGLLFCKKICPKCGNQLEKRVNDVLIKKGWKKITDQNNEQGFSSEYNFGKHYEREINYYCNHCKHTIKLKELGKKGLNNPLKKMAFFLSAVSVPIVLFMLLMIFILKSSGAYKEAIFYIEYDEKIQQTCKGIKGFSWFPIGEIHEENGYGKANYRITVKGKEKDITVQVFLSKTPSSDWEVEKLKYCK